MIAGRNATLMIMNMSDDSATRTAEYQIQPRSGERYGFDLRLEAVDCTIGWSLPKRNPFRPHGESDVALRRRDPWIESYDSTCVSFELTWPANAAVEKIRVPNEVRDKSVHGPIVQFCRRADLLNCAAIHDNEPIRHRERLFLIMGHKDRRQPKGLLELPDLQTDLLAKFGVKIREGFVQ